MSRKCLCDAGYTIGVVANISVAVIIDAPREAVFENIRNVESHTAWMTDAKQITIVSPQRQGVGLRFTVHTRLGPLATLDEMEVTRWEPGHLIGIEHRGIVKGTGSFTTADYGIGKTLFSWDERLKFPIRLGGGLSDVPARLALQIVFQRDLNNLKRIIEATPS